MTRLLSRSAVLGAFLVCSALAVFASSEEIQLHVRSWNVESGGADPEVIAEQIAEAEGIHLWGLSEVANVQDAKAFQEAAGSGESGTFKRIVGTTGRSDRLAILYDSDTLQFLDREELGHINIGRRVRAPLVARFKGKRTGQVFKFMVNHLYRGDASARHRQATLLNKWAREQSVPVIACGDWNFDWHFQTGDDPDSRDKGYDNLTKDDVFIWVRPEVLIPTQISDHNSVLDFVFVSGEASGWTAVSTIIVTPGDFDTDNIPVHSDHRPVDCVFSLDAAPSSPTETVDVSNAAILARIRELEEELQRLRQIVEEQ